MPKIETKYHFQCFVCPEEIKTDDRDLLVEVTRRHADNQCVERRWRSAGEDD